MSETIPPTFSQKLEALNAKEDKNNMAFQAEGPLLIAALSKIMEQLGDAYTLEEPIGRGGAGLVNLLNDRSLGIQRALKLPRPRQEEMIDSVHNEIEHLKNLRHDNLTRVYAAGEVAITDFPHPYPYFVMDFIPGASDFDKRVNSLLQAVSHARDLQTVTNWVAAKALVLARAIAFLHREETLHFDIKPANILFDSHDKPLLSDLGFAKKKTASTEKTIVGFTLFYAHPFLRREYLHMSNQNRVRRMLSPTPQLLT